MLMSTGNYPALVILKRHAISASPYLLSHVVLSCCMNLSSMGWVLMSMTVYEGGELCFNILRWMRNHLQITHTIYIHIYMLYMHAAPPIAALLS